MKDSKTEFRYFSIPQWKQEERYLREQHKSGWKFVRVDGICRYHFQKCEPEDVVYQLDYNPDSVSRKNEYIQMFRDCGWEYLQNYMGYSYFCKPASEMEADGEEIFCDDESRLDMMKRVFAGRMVPLLILFFLVLIPQLVMQGLAGSYGLLIVFGAVLGLYLALFAAFAVPFWRYYRAVRRR